MPRSCRLILYSVSLILLLLCLPVRVHPESNPSSLVPPFVAGEHLTYALSWFNILAGTAVMEVAPAPPVDGHPAYKLFMVAQSSPMVSRFYPVDNRVESLIDARTLSPYRMVFQRREGKRKNDYDVTFRHREGTVTVIKDGVTETVSIPPDAQDAISCLYYFRSLPSIEPGSSVFINVHHEKKTYRLEARIEGIERLKGPWGEVETMRILAIMPFQGIFLNHGNVQVWITNDARRVPVMMKAKVVIGSIVARLIEENGRSLGR